MRRTILGVALLVSAVSCRAPTSSSGAPVPSAAPRVHEDAAGAGPDASAQLSASAPTRLLPPAVERACSRDDECAVARVETSGAQTCCAACGTTPGMRRWHAALQRYCAAHPPASCPPLACPMGPTRAVCRSGVCEATATGADGGPTVVMNEARCLPAMVCLEWAGCALVAGNAQDGWFVQESERVARGEIASVESICTADAGCHEAAKLFPPDVVCAPTTVPPLVGPPPVSCALEGGHCRPAARR